MICEESKFLAEEASGGSQTIEGFIRVLTQFGEAVPERQSIKEAKDILIMGFGK